MCTSSQDSISWDLVLAGVYTYNNYNISYYAQTLPEGQLLYNIIHIYSKMCTTNKNIITLYTQNTSSDEIIIK